MSICYGRLLWTVWCLLWPVWRLIWAVRRLLWAFSRAVSICYGAWAFAVDCWCLLWTVWCLIWAVRRLLWAFSSAISICYGRLPYEFAGCLISSFRMKLALLGKNLFISCNQEVFNWFKVYSAPHICSITYRLINKLVKSQWFIS